jgi:predicted nucleic acid-binding protein
VKYLADKSALERQRHSAGARELLATMLSENVLASSHVVAMEVLYSARNRSDYGRQKAGIGDLQWLPVDEATMDRAMEVQSLLADRGQHRLPIPDLVVAATAEQHGATVLHYDKDFDLIAGVTGQPTRWITPRPRNA